MASAFIVATVVLLCSSTLLFLCTDPSSLRGLHAAAPSPSSKYRKYIVFLTPPPDAAAMDDDARRSWYQSFLPSNLTDSGEPRIVHTYKTLFQGFAAWLTEAELDAMSKKPGFSSWYPEIILHPATL